MRAAISLLKDPLFVLSAAITLTSGGALLTAKIPASGTSPASAPAGASSRVDPAAASSSPAAPAAPSIQGPGFNRALTPKTAGRWVVDAAKGKDSDTDSLADVLANAQEGDTVLLRPGTYPGGLRIEKSLAIPGQPSRGELPVISAQDAGVIELRGGNLRLEDLIVRQTAAGTASMPAAVTARGGSLALKRVSVESQGSDGLYLAGAPTTAEASSFRGANYGVWAARSSLECSGCTFAGSRRDGLSTNSSAPSIKLTDCKVFDNGGGVNLSSPATIERTQIYRNRGTGLSVGASVSGQVRLSDVQAYENERGLSFYGGEVLAEKIRVSRNTKVGLSVMGRARARLTDFKSAENGQAGLSASGDCQVELDQGEITGNQDEGVVGLGFAKLTLKRCRVTGNAVGIKLWNDSRADAEDCDFSGNRGDAYRLGDRGSIGGRRLTPAPPAPAAPRR